VYINLYTYIYIYIRINIYIYIVLYIIWDLWALVPHDIWYKYYFWGRTGLTFIRYNCRTAALDWNLKVCGHQQRDEQFRGAGEFKPHICKQVNVEEHTGDQNGQDSTKSCYTFANCSSAAELSPPASGWPQVTTAPPARIAANAKSVCWTSWTPLSCHHYNVNYSKWQQILLHIAMTEHNLNIICTYIIHIYTHPEK
jgi:hypothetical protein